MITAAALGCAEGIMAWHRGELAEAEVHLSRVYAKLGITTRAELAAQAAAQNLTARGSDE